MKITGLLLSLSLIACTGKSTDTCDTGDADCTGSAEPVTPNEGNWLFEEPEFSQDGCGIGDAPDSEETEDGDSDEGGVTNDNNDGDVVLLTKIGEGSYEFLIDEEDEAMTFPCTLDINELTCTDFVRTIEQDTVVLTQTISLGGAFASEISFAGTVGLSMSCSGEGCDAFAETSEMPMPCDSVGTFDGTHTE